MPTQLTVLGLALLAAAATAVTPTTSSVTSGSRRIETSLTFGWRFKRGDLPFNGGPLLCSDQYEEVAFPTSLRAKACTLGARENWARVTSDHTTNLPVDCSRACCTNPNCSLWSWYNNSNGASTHPAPTRPAGDGAPPYRYGDCYLGFGPTDPATQCSSENATDFVGGARSIDPLPTFPPRTPVSPSRDVAAPDFDDAKWAKVQLPHDYVIEGEPCFPALGCWNNLSNVMHGSYPKGIGWYRTSFKLPAAARAVGASSFLRFEGCLNDCQVFVNGVFVVRRFAAYSGFTVQLNSTDEPITVAVRADSRTNEGWFYEGGGLHRPVTVVTVPAVRIAEHGVYVTSEPKGKLGEDVTAAATTVRVSVELVRSNTDDHHYSVIADVIDPTSPTTVLHSASEQGAISNETLHLTMEVPSLKLWWSGKHTDKPALYMLRARLMHANTVLDEVSVTFGVRRAVFKADSGFWLNGVPLQIRGFCNHESFGGTGAAIPPRVNQYRIAKMKEMGANAWRGAHEPPAEDLLDAADTLGFLMWVENREFGQEVDGFLPQEQMLQNIHDMVKRSRNHPSVILWSLCNEGGCIQRSQEEAITKGTAAKKVIHSLDTSRPMTAAINYGSQGKECEYDCLTPTLDVIGMNYNWQEWDATHANYSNVPMLSSEMTRGNSARGIYDMLRVDDDGYYSVYSAAPGLMNSWHQINARKNWLAGGFLWTGYDYIGEPVSPVSVSSSFGAIDLCGFEKDSFYYFQANWSSTPAVHLVPSHWNFQVDQKVEVWAYTAHCASLELKLNGKSHSRYHAGRNFNPGDIAKFGNVTWENGTLEAICRDEHKVTVASDKIQTAGAPAGIRLDVDYNNDGLRGDGTDVFLARVTVVDANGVMVPEGPVPHGPRQHVNFEVTGGSVYGVCNGDPTTKRKAWFESDKASSRTTFNGLARVIVLANKLKSPADDAVVKLTATTDSSTGGGNFHAELTVKVHG